MKLCVLFCAELKILFLLLVFLKYPSSVHRCIFASSILSCFIGSVCGLCRAFLLQISSSHLCIIAALFSFILSLSLVVGCCSLRQCVEFSLSEAVCEQKITVCCLEGSFVHTSYYLPEHDSCLCCSEMSSSDTAETSVQTKTRVKSGCKISKRCIYAAHQRHSSIAVPSFAWPYAVFLHCEKKNGKNNGNGGR